MLKTFATIASLTALSLLATPMVFAGESCQPQYGSQECPNVVVTLDKKVLDPRSDDSNETKGGQAQELTYVDNITSSDTDRRYSPTEKIIFKLSVKNTSDQTVENVVIEDKIPVDAVSNISGDGSFDANTQTVSINVGTLGAQEEKTYYITGTVVGADRLPSDQDVVCAVNQSHVKVQNQVVDEDNATFCIEKGRGTVTKGGLPVHEAPEVTTTPPTGPAALALIPLAGSAIAGFVLRRKSL